MLVVAPPWAIIFEIPIRRGGGGDNGMVVVFAAS